jgi:guanine deaminase
VEDCGDDLIVQSFADLHLHAPQYPMLGTGMEPAPAGWLKHLHLPLEARFADPGLRPDHLRRLAAELVEYGTTRVCMFSSLHTDATLILMEELEKAGVTGCVGKVNMDRNAAPGVLEETTEESMSETLRWLEACGDFRLVKPMLTPRFTPSCSDELMAFLGKLAAERTLPVQSHLSENDREIQWVRELHPDCKQYWEDLRQIRPLERPHVWPTASGPMRGSGRPCGMPGSPRSTAPTPIRTSAPAWRRCGPCSGRG